MAAKLNDLQRHAKIPLLVAADLETGAGFRMWGAVYMPGTIELGGATNFPTLMAVGATGDAALAYEMGAITAEEARAVGIQVPFAPVLDVNNNPDNPIINVRSFGEDPDAVARLGAAFVRGMQEHGAIATGKHFPGHGDTGTDSHLALPTITRPAARMDSVELKPFRAAIDAGMGGIMTAHITVPALNGGNGDAGHPLPAGAHRPAARPDGLRRASSSPTPWTWPPSPGAWAPARRPCAPWRPAPTSSSCRLRSRTPCGGIVDAVAAGASPSRASTRPCSGSSTRRRRSA